MVLAGALPNRPCVVILDEVPWLAEQDPTFEGALQTGWDRLLSKRPVLLLLLGSDLHMMERMTAGYQAGETGFVMAGRGGRAQDVPAESVDLWWTLAEVIAAYPSSGGHSSGSG